METLEQQMLVDQLRANKSDIQKALVFLLVSAANQEQTHLPLPFNPKILFTIYCMIDEL